MGMKMNLSQSRPGFALFLVHFTFTHLHQTYAAEQ